MKKRMKFLMNHGDLILGTREGGTKAYIVLSKDIVDHLFPDGFVTSVRIDAEGDTLKKALISLKSKMIKFMAKNLDKNI